MTTLLRELARGAVETVRETLPSDEREAGVFLAGATWAFVIFILVLIFATWASARALGLPL